MPNALNKVSSVAYGGIGKVSKLALASISKVAGVAYSVAAPTLDRSYTGAVSNSGLGSSAGETYQCIKFTPTRTETTSEVHGKFKIGAGTLTGNITCYIYSSNGTIPVTNLGTVGTIDATTLTGTAVEYTFTGGGGAATTSGTEYWICYKYAGDGSNYVHNLITGAAGYGATSADGVTFSTWGGQMWFKQYSA